MEYRFIAEMRKTKEIVVLCEGEFLDLYNNIMGQFSESDNISRFAIEKNNEIVQETILRPKTKSLVLRRNNNESIHKRK